MKKTRLNYLLGLFIIFFATPVFAVDHVIISEVYYDPISTESGGEAIELYNPTNSSVDIGGWVVKTESSASDATVPASTVMPPDSFFLIADAGWSVSKDNVSWPDADYEEPISLTNSDAGVALLNNNQEVVDAVGWGNPALIAVGLFEGTPASSVDSGQSLSRTDMRDTDDNSVDFIPSVPDLRNSQYVSPPPGGSQSVSLGVQVTNSLPIIDNLSVYSDEDVDQPGIQIFPFPEQDKPVQITAVISDPDGIETLGSVEATLTGPDTLQSVEMILSQNINSSSAEFSADLNMSFYDLPGTYHLLINASDHANSTSRAIDFEYLSMTALSIDVSGLSFSGASLGEATQLLGDTDLTSSLPTVRNTGNTPLDISLYATDLVDGQNKIPVDNLRYSFDNDFGSSLSGELSSSPTTVTLGVEPGPSAVIGLGLQLFVPASTPVGNYSGELFVAGVGG